MRFHPHLRSVAQPLLIAGFLAASAAFAATQPGPMIGNPPAGSVILSPESPDVRMQSLHVLRQLPLDDIRKQPTVMVGTTRLNFKPMLENPRALFNIATSLRKLPQSAVVVQDSMTATEIDQGIVVQSKLTYRLKPGACDTGARRAMIAKAGVSCANLLSDSALAAAFANPKDVHFVADPGKRATALAAAKSNRAASSAQIAVDLAELRASLKDPAKRAQIDASFGASESARLAGLSDDQLTMELVNSAETTVDQTIFIPGAETPNARLSTSKFAPRNGIETGPLSLQPVNPAVLAGLGEGKQKSSSPPVQDTTHLLTTRIFLTGFTLGRHYEWSEGVSTTIKWCLVGCKKTYSAVVFARMGLGFGLRFPIQISGLYKHHLENGKETATITANYEPVNGTADDYAAAGLSKAQQFQGQEIVAEAVAKAGVVFDLPFYGHKEFTPAEVGEDYTSSLPAPFTNGQFKPPAPGELGFPALEKTFEDQDMLLGVANWGVFGAKVFPQVKFDLHSTSLKFKLHDLLSGKTHELTSSGLTYPLAVNAGDHSSHFTLSDPVYDLGFTVTPGLVGQLFIHLGVWGHDWNYGVWFPQVAVQLPPGGVKFACHEGTSCSRSYKFSPTSQSDSVGPASPNAEMMLQWKLAFENRWKPQCPDQKCKDAIWLIAFATGTNNLKLMDDEFAAAKAFAGNVSETLKLIKPYQDKIQKGYQDAENAAAEAVELARIRKSKQGHSTLPVTFTAMPKYPPPATSPPLMQGRTPIPTLAYPPPATPARSAPAVAKSTLCQFISGPRAGQVQDYAPMAPIPVGSSCQDARGSYGTVIAP